MLKVMSSVLSSFAAVDNSGINTKQRNCLRSYYLIGQLVDLEIKSLILMRLKGSKNKGNEENSTNLEETEEVNQNIRRVKLQAQMIALELGGYSATQSVSKTDSKDLASVPELSSLIEWDSVRSQLRFRHPLVMEYFIAKKIDEEIIEMAGAASKVV